MKQWIVTVGVVLMIVLAAGPILALDTAAQQGTAADDADEIDDQALETAEEDVQTGVIDEQALDQSASEQPIETGESQNLTGTGETQNPEPVAGIPELVDDIPEPPAIEVEPIEAPAPAEQPIDLDHPEESETVIEESETVIEEGPDPEPQSVQMQAVQASAADFNIEVTNLAVTCATLVSFNVLLTNTFFDQYETRVEVVLYDNLSDFQARTAPVWREIAFDWNTLSIGQSAWSQQLTSSGIFGQVDTFYVAVQWFLRGIPQVGEMRETVELRGSPSASVTGCTGANPGPGPDTGPDPDYRNFEILEFVLTCDGVLSVEYGDPRPANPVYRLSNGETDEILETVQNAGSPLSLQFDVPSGVYDYLFLEAIDVSPDMSETGIATYGASGCLLPDPVEPPATGSLELAFTLCAVISWDAHLVTYRCDLIDPSVDGAIVTWEVYSFLTPPIGVASVEVAAAAEPESLTYTAVLNGGVARTQTGQLPLGWYRVCVEPTLTGGPNGDVSLADPPPCYDVELTTAGAAVPAGAGFTAMLHNPRDPADDPTAPADPSAGEDGGSSFADPGDGDVGGAEIAFEASRTGVQALSAPGSATSMAVGDISLPNTGAGPISGASDALTRWFLMASAGIAVIGAARLRLSSKR